MWGAQVASMRRLVKIMERGNYEPTILIFRCWVRGDLREAIKQPMMLQDRLYKELIGITNDLQVTSAENNGSHYVEITGGSTSLQMKPNSRNTNGTES